MAMTKYEKQAKEYMDPYRKEALGDKLKLYQKKAQDTRKLYDTQIFETGRAYEDEYRENAVQKAINERQVAESMANMGLTDSGLNRTQQTAVNLSYANAKAGIDKTKRQAIDNIELQKASDLSTIRQNWLSDKAAINQTYDGYEADYAAGLEDAAAKRYAAYIKNQNNEEESYKVRNAGGKGKDDYGNEVYYFYDEKGKKYSYPKGINPYTGRPITGGYTQEELEHFGVWNGYQPKCVKYGGTNYGTVQKYETDNGTVQIDHQGHMKTIWQTGDGSLWVWDDEVGNYVSAWENSDGTFDYEIY